MEGVKFLETIRLENILSYGPDAEPFSLEPLNVLIGPNGSGKSNLIEALSLLAATPRDLQEPIRAGGGVSNWLWKGNQKVADATVEVTIKHWSGPLKYRLSFSEFLSHFCLDSEVIEQEDAPGVSDKHRRAYYRFEEGSAEIALKDEIPPRKLSEEEIRGDQSVLYQLRDRSAYPELWRVSRTFENIKLYREWDVSRSGPARMPQRPDDWQEYLLSDGSNLALVLNNLLNRPPVKAQILERMRDFYPSFNDIVVSISGGTVQVFFHERGLQHPIPATRLSDGSMRYLCLLAVLCNPDQRGIVCIEEPELGLHPDVIPEVAKLLIEASARSQIFVTTHSDMLVDALTDTPEAVIVCEKPEAATQLRRLSAAELDPWLEKYRLGDLWIQGQIGGTRW